MRLRIIDAAWHRNGVCGVGFWAILFDDLDSETEDNERRKVASLFDESGYCAVYAVDSLSNDNGIKFGRNSWRGDHYESDLRPLLKTWLKKNKSNRIGPFSVPDIEGFLAKGKA